MGYGYDMQSMFQQLEEMLGISLIASLASEIPSMLISLAVYVMTAVSLHTIAKRRGINNPWLAWVPFGNTWLLGCISDHYRAVTRRENKRRRKVLLILEIVISVIALLMVVLVMVMLFGILASGLINAGNLGSLDSWNQTLPQELIGTIAGPVVGMILLSLVLLPVSIIYAVLWYIALHDIYKSCDPGNATLYLLLGIFLSYARPIILFVCRNRDDGLPFRPVSQPVTNPTEQMEQ